LILGCSNWLPSVPLPDSGTTSSIQSYVISTSAVDALKHSKMCLLQQQYGNRICKMSWTWKKAKGAEEEWVPLYAWPTLNRIDEVWPEYAKGFPGQLPLREMEERWGTAWRTDKRTTTHSRASDMNWHRRKNVIM
jgi:hypothetical protein